jgi:hypothetical protein
MLEADQYPWKPLVTAGRANPPVVVHVLIIVALPASLLVALNLARQQMSCAIDPQSNPHDQGAETLYAVASRGGELPAKFRRMTREQISKWGDPTFDSLS